MNFNFIDFLELLILASFGGAAAGLTAYKVAKAGLARDLKKIIEEIAVPWERHIEVDCNEDPPELKSGASILEYLVHVLCEIKAQLYCHCLKRKEGVKTGTPSE